MYEPDLVRSARHRLRQPEWIHRPTLDSTLVASFAAYIDSLWCHEYGHGEIGVDCANTLYEALSDLPATGDCVALQSATEAETLSVIDVCIATNEQYDAETNHGATMGAVFSALNVRRHGSALVWTTPSPGPPKSLRSHRMGGTNVTWIRFKVTPPRAASA